MPAVGSGPTISIASNRHARARDAVLTSAGDTLLREAIPLWRVQQERVKKMLSAEEAEALRAHLGRLV